MNKLQIIDTRSVPAHERARAELEVSQAFIDNGKGQPFTLRETGADAFTVNDDGSISSSHEGPEVARAMVKLVLSKGAETFKPTGTDKFIENARLAMEQEQSDYDEQVAANQREPLTPYEQVPAQQQASTDGSETQRRHGRAEQANQDLQDEHAQKDKPDNAVTSTSARMATDDEQENKRRTALARKVANAYVVDGNRYMLRGDNPKEAFRDNGTAIKTKLDDERTVSDAIDLMASRGVQSIKVSGTKVFNRNAWIAAQSHRMTVAGYKPTAQDMAIHSKPENTVTDTTPEQTRVKEATQKPDGLSGKLIDHGTAPYQHNPDKNTSYYVMISDHNGNERTQWGVDLKSAIAKAGVMLGDNITLRKTDTKSVSVENELGEQVSGHRATWVVDSPERAAIVRQAREQDKAAIIKAAGAVAASRASEQSDRDAINALISERVDNHSGSLPEVPIYKKERQAPQVQQDEQQQELTL